MASWSVAAWSPAWVDGLLVALAGLGVGATAHALANWLDRELGGSPADPWYLSALAVVLLAVLQERWGHLDRAARAREHGRQARELHKEALRELYAWAGSALAAEE